MQQTITVNGHVFAMFEPVVLDRINSFLNCIVFQDHSYDFNDIGCRSYRLLQALSYATFKNAAEDNFFVLQKNNARLKILVKHNCISVMQVRETNCMKKLICQFSFKLLCHTV